MSFTLPLQLPIKHHIAQYLKIEFGQPFVFSKTNPFSTLFKRMLTADKTERQIYYPDNLDSITLNLTGVKVGSFISVYHYSPEMSLLENYFWSIMKHKVMEDTLYTRNVSESLRNIYDHYEIDEEIYSLDNFQRQITRKGIRFQSKKVYLKKQSFRKITEEECIQITRDFYIRRISIREIAKGYKVDKETIRRIKNKYKNKLISMSKNVPYLSQRINQIDIANFNRCSSLRSLS